MSRICVVTTTRAEYGLLVPLLRAIAASPRLDLQLVVSGTHLDPAHGHTIGEIKADGWKIDAAVEMPIGGAGVHQVRALAKGLEGFGRAFARQKPDAVVLLGDRFELLTVATAATVLRLPIVHLEGGHVTQGAIDDSVRHALTKLSHLHFTAHADYAARIAQMGEAPARIHVVGSLAVDNIMALPRLSLAQLEARAGIDLAPGFALLTYHPATVAGEAASLAELDVLLAALDAFPKLALLATAPNADPGGLAVRERLEAYVAARPGRTVLIPSLGRQAYLSAVALAALVIGNSSSGVIEAPALDTPCVNIGARQAGRLRSPGVFDCPADVGKIKAAIGKAMRHKRGGKASIFGDGHAAQRIVSILEATDFTNLLLKSFHDQPQQREARMP
ncbi:UDP-N-acetylglucosamine 2-epimerase (hydrolyzing) [Oleomonas cavernae]|uniref:UDP-N-acetylglucosamine 2-epimerase (Hydrolyzing) n=1 Tax=Oleomonas cavernae TaxID=2320859 RepID=A0A418WAK7_9PROT|nr:UDP-N-acetylglucosamine 2-epimerase [Oleomonas cavernae]RJF87091.1 UDP-N-acetylglucosamine 2-epimerase (hydrolyzing) [Oleomonas cavernae]